MSFNRFLPSSDIFTNIDFKYKIYLIDEAHQLSRSAFAGLLKILEQPPSYLKFILCSTEIEKFPHYRSIEALEMLSKKRGTESGFSKAEAFQLIRSIRRDN